MSKPIDFKKMFPNRNLQKEEKDWVIHFCRNAFDPIGTEAVKTEADFIKMCQENEDHHIECAQETVFKSERLKANLPYYYNHLSE